MKYFFSTLITRSKFALENYVFSPFSLFTALLSVAFSNVDYTNNPFAGIQFALIFLVSRFLTALILSYVKSYQEFLIRFKNLNYN